MIDPSPSPTLRCPPAKGRELALLMLADARLPVGGHAHSAGIEAAVGDGRVHDLPSLATFVRGRLATTGLSDASIAAATFTRLRPASHIAAARAVIRECDEEADARLPSPPLRTASRRLGRQLLRVAGHCWPSPMVLGSVPDDGAVHHAVAYGVVGVAADLGAADVARLVVYHSATTPAQAAVRLLGLDPFAVAGFLSALADVSESVVASALAAATSPLAELPAVSALLVELASVDHAEDRLRMFTT